MRIAEDVPLAPMTSLGVGGSARRYVEVSREAEAVEAILAADARSERVLVLGGGTNLVVADEGFDGLVVRMISRGVDVVREGDHAVLEVQAGEPWDDVVALAVSEGWSGVEALSGIPGLAGATPIQNVGAYGQEVKDVIRSVTVLDRRDRVTRRLASDECGFAYRASAFKGSCRFVVLRVVFALEARRESRALRYAELTRALSIGTGGRAPLGDVRCVVLALRAAKGMVLDPSDPDSKSAGSFFVNPILDAAELAALEGRVRARGLDVATLPRFPEADGRTKVAAAWLIERAGFGKGWGEGRAGISRKHALALVNRGGATASELLAVARAIEDGVRGAFAVELVPEPVIVGTVR